MLTLVPSTSFILSNNNGVGIMKKSQALELVFKKGFIQSYWCVGAHGHAPLRYRINSGSPEGCS